MYVVWALKINHERDVRDAFIIGLLIQMQTFMLIFCMCVTKMCVKNIDILL